MLTLLLWRGEDATQRVRAAGLLETLSRNGAAAAQALSQGVIADCITALSWVCARCCSMHLTDMRWGMGAVWVPGSSSPVLRLGHTRTGFWPLRDTSHVMLCGCHPPVLFCFGGRVLSRLLSMRCP